MRDEQSLSLPRLLIAAIRIVLVREEKDAPHANTHFASSEEARTGPESVGEGKILGVAVLFLEGRHRGINEILQRQERVSVRFVEF